MKTKADIIKEIEELKQGKTFWATKVSPKLKKRKVKIKFDYKKSLIKEKKDMLKGYQLAEQNFQKMIEKLKRYEYGMDDGMLWRSDGDYVEFEELKKQMEKK